MKRLFSSLSLLACLAYFVPLALGLFIPRGRYAVIGAILALPLIPVFIRAAARFFASSRTTAIQVEFGALFVVLTALLIQLTGFVDSPFYPLMFLTASILALVLRPVIGLCLLILLAAVDIAPRLTRAGHPFVLNDIMMTELILLLFFGFFLLYTRLEARRHREMSRTLVRYKDDMSGISGSPLDHEKGVSEEKIGKQTIRALRNIDDFLFDILNRTKTAIGADTVAYLLPAGGGRFRIREAASSDEKFNFEALPTLQTYRAVMTRGEPALFSAGQGPRGIDTGYYTGRPSGSACIAVVPVSDGRTVSGLLVCDGRIAGGISEKDIRILEVAAATIRNAEKSIAEYHRLRVGLEEHEGLYDISTRLANAVETESVFRIVYESCTALISATTAMAVTRVVQAESHVLSVQGKGLASVVDRTFPNDGSLVGWVIENKKQLAYPQKERKRNVFGRQIDFPADGSLAIFPLLSEEEVIGTCCLLIASPKTPSSFHSRLIELILSMAVESWLRIESKQQLEAQALTDPLTGLSNRRSFTRALEHMVDRADRYTEPLSLLMIDIDRFKAVNDTYGHAVGDVVIKAVADTIQSSIRKVDVAARVGGEEFAVILPESIKKSSVETAERIRKAVRSRVIRHGRASLSVTVSIGIATRSGGGQIPDTLITEADRYLYAAKEGGRDRCESA